MFSPRRWRRAEPVLQLREAFPHGLDHREQFVVGARAVGIDSLFVFHRFEIVDDDDDEQVDDDEDGYEDERFLAAPLRRRGALTVRFEWRCSESRSHARRTATRAASADGFFSARAIFS